MPRPASLQRAFASPGRGRRTRGGYWYAGPFVGRGVATVSAGAGPRSCRANGHTRVTCQRPLPPRSISMSPLWFRVVTAVATLSSESRHTAAHPATSTSTVPASNRAASSASTGRSWAVQAEGEVMNDSTVV